MIIFNLNDYLYNINIKYVEEINKIYHYDNTCLTNKLSQIYTRALINSNLESYYDDNGEEYVCGTDYDFKALELNIDRQVYRYFSVHLLENPQSIADTADKNIYKFIAYNGDYYDIDDIEYVIEQAIDDYRNMSDIRYFDLPSIYEYTTDIRPMNQQELNVFAKTNNMYITSDGNYTSDITKAAEPVKNISIYWREMPETWIRPNDNIMNNVDEILRKQYSYIYYNYFVDSNDYYGIEEDDDIEWYTPDEWFDNSNDID